MKSLGPYYITRVVLVLILMTGIYALGGSWWMAVLMGILAMGYFLWVPHIGRFVQVNRSAAPFRRDERTQAISARAATYSFVILTLLLAVALLLGDTITLAQSTILSGLLLAGLTTYFIAELVLGGRG